MRVDQSHQQTLILQVLGINFALIFIKFVDNLWQFNSVEFLLTRLSVHSKLNNLKRNVDLKIISLQTLPFLLHQPSFEKNPPPVWAIRQVIHNKISSGFKWKDQQILISSRYNKSTSLYIILKLFHWWTNARCESMDGLARKKMEKNPLKIFSSWTNK